MISQVSRRLLLICTVIVALVCLGDPAFAQQGAGDCYPDCATSLWGPLKQDTVMLMPCGEPIIIEYKTRFACNTWYDVQLVRIVFLNGTAGGTNCGMTMDIKEMVDSATSMLLVGNPMGFPPPLTAPNGTCVSNWRVMKGACWRSTFPVHGAPGYEPELGMVHQHQSSGGAKSVSMAPLVPLGMLEPCSFTLCCLQSVQVCIIDGQRVITKLPGGSYPGECDPNHLLNCVPVCE